MSQHVQYLMSLTVSQEPGLKATYHLTKEKKACNTNLSEKGKLMLSKTVSVAGKATGKR